MQDIANSRKKSGSSSGASRGRSRDPRWSLKDLSENDRWESWQAHLAGRSSPPPLTELGPGRKASPLLWAVPHRCGEATRRLLEEANGVENADERMLVDLADRARRELAEPPGAEDAVEFGLSRLAFVHALPRLARFLEQETWRGLLERFLSSIEEAAAIPLDHDPLGRLLLGGETPLAIAYLFPELRECRSWDRPARRTLSDGLVELLDGEGLPAAKHLPLLRPLLALTTRCGLMAEHQNKDCFTREARHQYQWLVQRAILLSRPNGVQLLSPGDEGAWSRDLFEAALLVSGDPDDEALAHAVLPMRGSKEKAPAPNKLPAPAFHSEWAEVGLLRAEASRRSPRLLTAYGERRILAELTNRNEVVFSGPWTPHIEIDGRRHLPNSDWEEVCWVSDEDVDYLELEIALTHRWRVQRQMLLARRDGFLFVADAVLGEDPGRIEYRGAAPLAPGVAFLGEGETRDGLLVGEKKLAAVLPLALPEWRVDRRFGDLASSASGLKLTLSGEGRGLLAPLFFDLSKKRFKRERTWRRLTVAERLEIVRPDVAVGYRVQVGKEQWLFYRSLAPAGNRTVLGQNFANEFVAARFHADGTIEELISVSSGEEDEA